jgi:hypothetical protein
VNNQSILSQNPKRASALPLLCTMRARGCWATIVGTVLLPALLAFHHPKLSHRRAKSTTLLGATPNAKRIRRIVTIVQDRYKDEEEWVKLRNYLYRSNENELTESQVRQVLDYLDTTVGTNVSQSLLQSSPRILRKNCKTQLQPTVAFLRQLYGEKMFQLAVQRKPDLLLARGLGYKAHQASLEEDLVELYLTTSNELLLTPNEIEKLKSSYPFLFQRSVSKIMSVVAFLQQKLLVESSNPRTLTKMIMSHPTILQLSVETNLQPSMEFLQDACQLQDSELASILLTSKGSILLLSVGNLRQTLDVFKDILSREQKKGELLRRALVRHPQLLGLSLANLQSKADYFQSMDDRLAARVLVRATAVYSLSLSQNIVPTVEFLTGIWGDKTASLLSEYPSILTLSLEGNLRPTVNFYNRTGYVQLDDNWQTCDSGSTVLRGRNLAASLFQRLLPRWHFSLQYEKKLPLYILTSANDVAYCSFLGNGTDSSRSDVLLDYQAFRKEATPRLKFSSQFDTWIKTGRPIDIE